MGILTMPYSQPLTSGWAFPQSVVIFLYFLSFFLKFSSFSSSLLSSGWVSLQEGPGYTTGWILRATACTKCYLQEIKNCHKYDLNFTPYLELLTASTKCYLQKIAKCHWYDLYFTPYLELLTASTKCYLQKTGKCHSHDVNFTPYFGTFHCMHQTLSLSLNLAPYFGTFHRMYHVSSDDKKVSLIRLKSKNKNNFHIQFWSKITSVKTYDW